MAARMVSTNSEQGFNNGCTGAHNGKSFCGISESAMKEALAAFVVNQPASLILPPTPS